MAIIERRKFRDFFQYLAQTGVERFMSYPKPGLGQQARTVPLLAMQQTFRCIVSDIKSLAPVTQDLDFSTDRMRIVRYHIDKLTNFTDWIMLTDHIDLSSIKMCRAIGPSVRRTIVDRAQKNKKIKRQVNRIVST